MWKRLNKNWKHKQAANAACFFVAKLDTFYKKNWKENLILIIGYTIIIPTIRNKEIPLREQREI